MTGCRCGRDRSRVRGAGGQSLTELPLVDREANGPYVVTLRSGDLPDGLMLHTDGSFTGRTTVPGTFRFTVEACDRLGACATYPIIVTVVANRDIPTTGVTSGAVTRWALAFLGAGVLLVSIGRRRPRSI